MPRYIVFILCSLAVLLTNHSAVAQDRPDVLIFDEDDAIGEGYYDASVGLVNSPSQLRLGGPGDKLIVLTNLAHSGVDSGLLQWQSAPGGTWIVFVARPGFNTADASGYSNLVLHVNSPAAIAAANLPLIGLESSPPDVQSARLKMGDFLPGGIDADSNTWQRVELPLSAFPPKATFSLGKVKDVFFSQGATDNVPRTVWFDDVRLLAGSGAEPNVVPASRPTGLVTRAGDRSVTLHWDRNETNRAAGYHVYRKSGPDAQPVKLTASPLPVQSFADFQVTNGQTCVYVVRAVNSAQQESPDSNIAAAVPAPFASDDAFLEYVQQTAFDYFWYEVNPVRGLVRDRNDPVANASTAATGFGLSGIAIGVDRGWITRPQGAARVLATLRTFGESPQGPNLTGTIGYRGWFYHFLDMETGLRSGTTELSSIDTALLLAGILDCKQFFNGSDTNEVAIRSLADLIVNRVDWQWMANGGNSLSHGWRPESGFISSRWIGYNEAMILYLLGLGAATNPLPAVHWETWTSGYTWRTNDSLAFVPFPPLFGHQYSHCWVDFRHNADAYMRAKASTYFENSRRATLAQREYCVRNPGRFAGYSTNVWGLTACDGPGFAPFLDYTARGTPPPVNDDGTIAPTAAGGSLPFTPEYSVPALRFMYDRFLTNIWTGYGFRDAFNLEADWWGPHVLGIDQGPILLMAENFRSGRVWKRFMQNPEIQRGLLAAGFETGEFRPLSITPAPAEDGHRLSWNGASNAIYQVEYSPDLISWLVSPSTPSLFQLIPASAAFSWLDAGPPSTLTPPAKTPARFYRLFQLPTRD